jgi:tetratricopeptide (TPR) repeat protein
VLTSLIRFAFVSFLFFTAAVFAADNASVSTEPSASQTAPQPIANTPLPEWLYRELMSIRKDVSVLDATGASKEQIQELKERIGKVEVRLEETQLRVDSRLSSQNNLIGSIYASVDQFGILITVLGLVASAIAVLFGWISAGRRAKSEANLIVNKWIDEKQEEITGKLEREIDSLGIRFDKELKDVREHAELQSIKTMINRALSMAEGFFGHKFNEAVEELSDAIKKYADYKNPEVQEQVVYAYILKGEILAAKGNSRDAITEYNYVITNFRMFENPAIKLHVEVAFANKIEQLFLTGQHRILKETMKQTSDYISQDSSYFSVVELYKFMVGVSDSNTVYNCIDSLPKNFNLAWSFNLIKPEVSKLQQPIKGQATAFIKFFEEHKDKAKLKEELAQISNT